MNKRTLKIRLLKLLTALSITIAIIAVNAAESQAAATYETDAKTATVIDVSTGNILFAKNSHEMLPPSSMSKLMTVYMLFDALKQGKIKMDQTITVSADVGAKADEMIKGGGSTMYLKAGDTLTVGDLLHGIVIASANEACVQAAELLFGSEEQYAIEANKKAKELGMNDTNIINASGWPDPNHLMSSYDLALLTEHLARDFPQYYTLFKTKQFSYIHSPTPFINRNKLLWLDPSAEGMKTGHSSIGGYGIVGAFDRGGRKIVAVMNGINFPPTGEADINLKRAFKIKDLVDWAYDNTENYEIFQKDAVIATAPVWFGKKKEVDLGVANDLIVSLEKGGYRNLEAKAYYNSPIQYGLKKGAQVGELVITRPSPTDATAREEITRVPLVIKEDTEKMNFARKFLENIITVITRII